MKHTLLALVALVLLTFIFASSAGAQSTTWDDRSYLTFNSPVSLPGVTLPAGTYLFRFPSRYTSRRVVQVLSRDGKIAYAMMSTMPIWRQRSPHDPEVTFKETRADAAPAIDALFQPHARVGYEFRYPKGQTTTTATN